MADFTLTCSNTTNCKGGGGSALTQEQIASLQHSGVSINMLDKGNKTCVTTFKGFPVDKISFYPLRINNLRFEGSFNDGRVCQVSALKFPQGNICKYMIQN